MQSRGCSWKFPEDATLWMVKTTHSQAWIRTALKYTVTYTVQSLAQSVSQFCAHKILSDPGLVKELLTSLTDNS